MSYSFPHFELETIGLLENVHDAGMDIICSNHIQKLLSEFLTVQLSATNIFVLSSIIIVTNYNETLTFFSVLQLIAY